MAAGPREGIRLSTGERSAAERGWLDSQLVRIGGLVQGQRDLTEVCNTVMTEVAPLVNAQVGAIFLRPFLDGGPAPWRLSGSYGLTDGGTQVSFSPGEGLVGQAATGKQVILLTDVPPSYLPIRSGTGGAGPAAVVVLPLLFEDEALGVLEFGSLTPFSEVHLTFLQQLAATVAVTINTIQANRRTVHLLAQSQRFARQMQEQVTDLQHTKAELEERVERLTERNRAVEARNLEIDSARRNLEEQVQRYARASRGKSEFLANARHELRAYAAGRDSADTDLPPWFDDVFDLAGIDLAGIDGDRVAATVTDPLALSEVRDYVEQTCGPPAQAKGLLLQVRIAEGASEQIVTDVARLRQLLRILLAEAVRCTESGDLTLRIHPVAPGTVFDLPALDTADRVVAFTVPNSGLGLAVSRELARMLGGTITLNEDSTCTVYLPSEYPPDDGAGPRRPVGDLWDPPTTLILRAPPLGRSGAAPVRGLDGSTVLIIDDDVRNVFALTSALELHGIRVFYADSSADGLQLLVEHPEVDVVLMDASIPELDVNRTTRAIRQLPGGASLPVVFLTAKAMPSGRELSVAAGATDCITKPVDLDELLAALSTWVARYRSGAGEG